MYTVLTREGAAGLSCTELSIWEFPFLRGAGWQRRNTVVYDIVWMGSPRRTTWTVLRTPVCFRILSTSFTSVSIFSVCCYSSVSISVMITTWGTQAARHWSLNPADRPAGPSSSSSDPRTARPPAPWTKIWGTTTKPTTTFKVSFLISLIHKYSLRISSKKSELGQDNGMVVIPRLV